MHHVVALYGPPADPDHFQEYYINTHLPLAAKLPGLKAMHYSFSVETLREGSQYFCTWVGQFDDAAAMGAAMASQEGQALAADIPNYASGGVTLFHYHAETPRA